ncbi:MAG: ABC transporter ATP-binding protein, partial [Candidatus Micrarchaeia archaeon]
TFKIHKGEFVSIMGPSGSGKSTTMNLIGCLDIPSRGEVLLDGMNIAHLSESSLARIRGKKIGFVFQQFNLISAFTAKENVMLPMMFQDMPKTFQEERARQLLKRVGLEHRLEHKPTELSGGEQQRVAIARALANDPQMILADEPTGNLDSKAGHEIMEMIRELNEKDGKTIVFVTHDQALAERYADRIIRLKDGRIVKD